MSSGCDRLSLLLQIEPTRRDTVMLTMQTSNVQPFIVLDGIRCANSACPETVWAQSIDLSPNIDLERRFGASTLETPGYQLRALVGITGRVTTKGR